jgi:transcriptional regulator with XRE-family HTH domain
MLNLSQHMREEHMPAKRLAMRQIKDVLRLKWGQGLSQRQIARSLGISRPAVAEYLQRAEQAGLSWPVPEALDDKAVEQLLFPARPMPSEQAPVMPDWAYLHRELKRTSVTLFLLWQEYKAAEPGGFQYSWFAKAIDAGPANSISSCVRVTAPVKNSLSMTPGKPCR